MGTMPQGGAERQPSRHRVAPRVAIGLTPSPRQLALLRRLPFPLRELRDEADRRAAGDLADRGRVWVVLGDDGTRTLARRPAWL